MTIKELIRQCINEKWGPVNLTEIYEHIEKKTNLENTDIRKASIRGTLYHNMIWWKEHTDLFIRTFDWIYDINKDISPQEAWNLFSFIEDEIHLEEEISNSSVYDFHLEKHLEDFLSKNLNLIENWLKLVEWWRQYRLENQNWYIDLLCTDKKNNYVVIELKKWNNSDQVIGQILRYIWCIQENFNTDKVRGIVITHESDEKLKYATKGSKKVELKEYQISFIIK